MSAPSEAPVDREDRFCTFFLGEDRYALGILSVREIQRNVRITPARAAPAAVVGLANLRGQIVTVLDPALRLGCRLPVQAPDARGRRLVILRTNADLRAMAQDVDETADDLVGLSVDRISDVLSFGAAELAPPPPSALVGGQRLLRAVVQRDGELIRVLDARALLDLSGGVSA